MATIPCTKAGDSDPRRSRHWFNPLETTWSPRRTPHHFSPLGDASAAASESAITPGEPVVIRFRNNT